MSRIYNFSAGPAMLPGEVIKRAASEMEEWHGSGMSVMEMSHRGKEFMSIAGKAEADLRELMDIPGNYKVLFLQGGASSQFAMVPMNLLKDKKSADYINTGAWSRTISGAGFLTSHSITIIPCRNTSTTSKLSSIPSTWKKSPWFYTIGAAPSVWDSLFVIQKKLPELSCSTPPRFYPTIFPPASTFADCPYWVR